MQTIIIKQPDDWHVHLRDGEALKHTVAATAAHCHRALVMPNLKPALTSAKSLAQYRERILEARPQGSEFIPYMTYYLNEAVDPNEFNTAARNHILGAKLYPAGATTNSDEGAKSLTALYPALEVLQDCGLVLQIHGEVTHGDIFEREALFLSEYLAPIIKAFPKLRIVLEHISTRAAVDFIAEAPEHVAATITPHHLLYNRNQLLAGGIRPHYYCLPILKHADCQLALRQAIASGNPKFFAGTDSAPHAIHTKETACGCAGIYSAPYAIALYAQVFDEMNALGNLEPFLSHFGADFYQLPRNIKELVLERKPQHIPQSLPFGTTTVVPVAAGETIPWSVHEAS